MFEAENPLLRSLPLAVQQKQIIVTCNYEARRRGLYKLQLIREARKTCPDVIIVLGEDLTRFRNASKELYTFLSAFVWSSRAERLGFDEVFLDVTDLVDFNLNILNFNSLADSFFHLDRTDPTVGFSYDASSFSGSIYPSGEANHGMDNFSLSANITYASLAAANAIASQDLLAMRLRLGSHLAQHLRHQLEEQKGYTATVGISTNKLVSKLVGNVNKPKNQTTLIPPYTAASEITESNVLRFMDNHEIGKIPGIGFKLSQKIRTHVLGHEAKFHEGLVYGGTKEHVLVRDVRLYPGMCPVILDEILKGPGSHQGIGSRVWGLLHGVDDTEVGKARSVPKQISIEDSYLRLNTFKDVSKELRMLAASLIRRMRIDLTAPAEDEAEVSDPETGPNLDVAISAPKRWLAHPRTVRLTTRPRPPLRPDGTRSRTFTRISRSSPMPFFVFSLTENVEVLVDKLVDEIIIPLFRKLHPGSSGWDLSLVNIGATDMMETAGDSKDADGRDIGRMFQRQDEVLREWKVEDKDVLPSQYFRNDQKKVLYTSKVSIEDAADERNQESEDMQMDSEVIKEAEQTNHSRGSEDDIPLTQSLLNDDDWDSSETESAERHTCGTCGAIMPSFAMGAHERFHLNPD